MKRFRDHLNSRANDEIVLNLLLLVTLVTYTDSVMLSRFAESTLFISSSLSNHIFSGQMNKFTNYYIVCTNVTVNVFNETDEEYVRIRS